MISTEEEKANRKQTMKVSATALQKVNIYWNKCWLGKHSFLILVFTGHVSPYLYLFGMALHENIPHSYLIKFGILYLLDMDRLHPELYVVIIPNSLVDAVITYEQTDAHGH